MSTKKTNKIIKITNTIVVCEGGWILVGVITGYSPRTIQLIDGQVVRKWNNGRGIGGLAKEKYKSEYTLDPIGAVNINESKILFTIPCEW